ncbi:hypothetical protein BaRGS_00016263 [Batillaria attramentaria]|uniref:Uncharacterized protein n=1 Tax=Batillaria attramentaria TaxID=370345 RepID=A0ABD0KZ71_9CAEN
MWSRTSAAINTAPASLRCTRRYTRRLVGSYYCYTKKKLDRPEHRMPTPHDGMNQRDKDNDNVQTNSTSDTRRCEKQ